MKLYSLLFILTILAITSSAQPGPNPGMNELKEKVIGWDKIQSPLGNAPGKSLTVQGRTYTSYQIGLIDTFTNWIKKSYIPIGGLPQPQRMALPDDATRRPYAPKGTGVIMGMWVPCYDASGKKIVKAQPASASYITILTNHINGIEKAGDWYNTPSQYYFTMYYDTKGKLVNNEDAQKDAPYVNEIKSKIGNYFIYFTRTTVNVVLMPGKELPIVQATKAEVLDKAEESVQRAYANKTMPLRTDILDNIKKLREKYKNSLQEPAFVQNTKIDMYTFYPSFDDLFEKQVNTRYMYPVYKTNPAIYDLCNKDKPQWVTISWPYATEKSSTVEWEIFKAMTSNFNFQYVHDYFFDPEKVKGKSYQPLKQVSQAAAIEKDNKKQSLASQSKTYSEGIHFMEDFANASTGTMPAGWTSTQNNRNFIIETPKGENGKWLLFDSGADIIPSSVKKPLPQNFTLEFDLITTDFTNRAGRTITVFLNDGKSTYMSISVAPGNNENLYIYPSTADIRLNALGKAARHDMEFNSYSNKKSKAHVQIIKSGTSVKAFVNGTQIKSDPKYNQNYDQEMQMADKVGFTSLQWKSDVASANENKGNVYISNIKIIKE